MPRHATNTCFLVHSQEKTLLSLTLVRIGEMIQEMPFRMSFPHVLMAGRPQQILHGGTLKYLFGYFNIRIFYCSNRTSLRWTVPRLSSWRLLPWRPWQGRNSRTRAPATLSACGQMPTTKQHVRRRAHGQQVQFDNSQQPVSSSRGEFEHCGLVLGACRMLGVASTAKDCGLHPNKEVTMDWAKHVDTQYHWVQVRTAKKEFRLKKESSDRTLAS